ncbi:hypothetical protein BDN72DRAFT_526282 [Pluteus cervinus]|uniref:Uncharacterized protein n=1 Tax=Pluteus cervinus TaxID=181527 RepID=A0ACD3A514_9AGAR|nr:hypothetical protein BDN72DRAFT_526282 [Pluteus cervinus]
MDVDIDHANTATDTERWLPNELWLTIFHHLIQPNDLCHIIQTSRKFYTLALPLLLVRLQWRNTTGALRNLAFWDGQAREACLIPRELVVGIVGVGSAGYFNGGSVGGHGGGGGDGGGGGIGGGGGGGGTVTTTALTLANVGAGGRLPPVPGSTAWSSIVESQETIYTQILQRIPKFTSLQTLTLTDARLPLYFYGLLQSLPALTNLGIYRCSLRLIPWDTPIIQSAWTMKLGSMCLEDIQVTEDTTSLVGGGGGNVNPFHGLVAINAQNQGHPALVNAILANAGVNNVVGANTGNNINPGGGGVGPAGALGGGAGGGGGNDGGAPPPPQPPPAPLHPLKLLHSFLQLEDLTLSWRGDIAVSYLRSVWKLPQNLRTLTVHIKSLSQFNLSSVVALLRGCAGSVRRVRMRVGHVSKCLEVPEVRLPWLVEFSGPAVMAPAILVHGTGAGVPQDSGNPTPLPIAIGTVAAADDNNMDTDEEDSAAAAAAERLATGLKVLEIHGPVPLQAFLDMIEKPAAREVEKLTVLVQQWDAEALHAVSQLLPNLKSLTMVYAAGGPSDEFLVSIGPELLKRLSSLQTLVLLSECPEGGGGQATSSASASHQMQGGLRAHAHTHASIHNGRGGHHNPNHGHGQGQGQIANLAHGRTHHNPSFFIWEWEWVGEYVVVVVYGDG